jgi:hypothetical protein
MYMLNNLINFIKSLIFADEIILQDDYSPITIVIHDNINSNSYFIGDEVI